MSVPGDEKNNSLNLMFQEALQAARAGDRTRARDLLTRLLKVRQDRVDYWIWMSAVVETSKERIFCLKEVIRLDPDNALARRGLTILGALPPDENLVVPVRLQKRAWQAHLPGNASLEGQARQQRMPVYQVVLIVFALAAVTGLMAFAFLGAQKQNRPRRSPIIILPTLTAVAAVEGTPSPTHTVLSGKPVPLWIKLEATYTPTPLYIDTPHPVSEAYRIGLRSLHREDYKNADNYFRQAATEVAKSDPGSVDVLYYVAENIRLQGEFSDALKVYQEVIRHSPDFAPAYLGRARTWLAQDADKLAEEALVDLQTAVEIDPMFVEAYQDLAALLIQSGRYEDALQVLEDGAEVLDHSPLAYLYRAQAYLYLRDASNALANARRANEMDITQILTYRVLGEALQLNGDMQGSLEPLLVYTNHLTRDPQAWLLLGKAYLAAEQPEEAIIALDRALRLDNRLSGIYLLRAGIYLDQADADKALTDYQAALRLDPVSFEASLGTGKALMMLNYPGDAWDRFERSQKLAETELQKAELIFWRGQSLERLGQLDAAVRDYQTLVDLPLNSVQEEWVEFARGRLEAMTALTPTTQPRFPTATPARTLTRTPTATITKKP